MHLVCQSFKLSQANRVRPLALQLINGMNDSLSRRIGALEVLAPASNTLHLTRPTSFRNAKEGNAAPEAVLEAVLNEVGTHFVNHVSVQLQGRGCINWY
jgi:hypothetical protein